MVKWSTVALRVMAVTVPIALGVAIVLASRADKSEPREKEAASRVTPVRVITLEPIDLVPRVRGYGSVSPANVWRAVNRIDGEITWTSDRLANGLIVEKGEELVRIDDTGIRLSLGQNDAQIVSLNVKEETLRASIAISADDLELSRAQVARQQDLVSRGVGTPAALEAARRQELSARANLKNLENQLALSNAERDVLSAQRAILARDLDYAVIRAPFAMLIGEVQAEQGQVVTRGQTLFSADGIERMEVAAQFPIGRMGPLVRGTGNGGGKGGPLDLKAVVRLRAPGHAVEWPAQIERIGEFIDPRTQSANVIVSVEQPFDLAEPGVRPPLRRNMFIEVELSAPARKVLALPAEAIADGKVLVVGADDRLAYRAIETGFIVDGIAVVSGGLEAGIKVVVTDMSLAVPGMAVRPLEDEVLKARLAADALSGSFKQ
ncbi:MAG: efflux RND transporter periplasmic adaptor subunit [Notoacmeibacter sp.]|nr:efflux RND transporter periplasmic adaptor subunit [Notoacmeibacter sp.]